MTEYNAKELLINSNNTCVSVKGDQVYQSDLKGIQPIISKLKEDPTFFEGAYVADVVIGKAAAMLLIYGRAHKIYARLISEHAIAILKEYQIPYEYDIVVPYIMNRKKDGICPMEDTVLNINDPKLAYDLLLKKIN